MQHLFESRAIRLSPLRLSVKRQEEEGLNSFGASDCFLFANAFDIICAEKNCLESLAFFETLCQCDLFAYLDY